MKYLLSIVIAVIVFISGERVALAPILPELDAKIEKELKFVMSHKVGFEKASEIVHTVRNYSNLFGIDERRFLALISVESMFKPKAISGYGAKGYAQVVDKWHSERIKIVKKILGGYDAYEMKSNLMLSALIQRDYLKQYGNHRMYQAYNGNLSDPEMRYTNKILKKYKEMT